jgi:hypothetical protein
MSYPKSWKTNKQTTPAVSPRFQLRSIRELLSPPDLNQIMNQSSDSNDKQIGGRHYHKCAIQPWDFVIANDLDYFQGSIIKYVTRWKDKGWIEDLHKAKHFLDKYIETMEAKHKQLSERPE